jgi:hypothetical protein
LLRGSTLKKPDFFTDSSAWPRGLRPSRTDGNQNQEITMFTPTHSKNLNIGLALIWLVFFMSAGVAGKDGTP